MLVNLARYQISTAINQNQLNDKFATVSDVGAYVLAERTSRGRITNVLTTALKVDGETKWVLFLILNKS